MGVTIVTTKYHYIGQRLLSKAFYSFSATLGLLHCCILFFFLHLSFQINVCVHILPFPSWAMWIIVWMSVHCRVFLAIASFFVLILFSVPQSVAILLWEYYDIHISNVFIAFTSNSLKRVKRLKNHSFWQFCMLLKHMSASPINS